MMEAWSLATAPFCRFRARGGTLIHILNGQLMAVLIDDDPASSNNAAGKIGIELEGTPAKVSVRNIWIKKMN